MHYRVFDTYKSCNQIRITIRPKLVLTNFIQYFLSGLWCVWQPNQVLNYVRCSKFDIKMNYNKAYHYIMECIAYLLVPSGIFPAFLRPFSFPSSTRAFHSLDGIIGGRSYLGFFSRWTLYWSRTIFKCFPSFFRTFNVSKVSLPNRPTNRLVNSFCKYFGCLSHLVQMVDSKISKVKSFIFL